MDNAVPVATTGAPSNYGTYKLASSIDYIHYNPVSHDLGAAPKDWHYSSFHRYVWEGIYPEDWGEDGQVILDSGVGRE